MILGCRAKNVRRLAVFFASCAITITMWAANVTPSTRDTLVYKDGDRLHGVLVEQSSDLIIFKSDRFGELRVSASSAVVIKAEKSAAAVAAEKGPATPPSAPAATPAGTVAAQRKEAAAAAETA